MSNPNADMLLDEARVIICTLRAELETSKLETRAALHELAQVELYLANACDDVDRLQAQIAGR